MRVLCCCLKRLSWKLGTEDGWRDVSFIFMIRRDDEKPFTTITTDTTGVEVHFSGGLSRPAPYQIQYNTRSSAFKTTDTYCLVSNIYCVVCAIKSVNCLTFENGQVKLWLRGNGGVGVSEQFSILSTYFWEKECILIGYPVLPGATNASILANGVVLCSGSGEEKSNLFKLMFWVVLMGN